MVMMLFLVGRDEGVGDLIVLEGEDIGDLFPHTVGDLIVLEGEDTGDMQ
jgi:hypothetical protein